MIAKDRYQPVDYLIIGHVSQDLTPEGIRLGGTASYASLTARALGLKVGLVTAVPGDLSLSELVGIEIARSASEFATTFENITSPDGRIQTIHHRADDLTLNMVPDAWRSAPIVHLGPIAREVDPQLVQAFPNSLVGFTPQGWLRDWDQNGRVAFRLWPEAQRMIQKAGATVLSVEDVNFNEPIIDEFVQDSKVLVVTEGQFGGRLYWNGDVRRVRCDPIEELDATGAGDIFAAAFFYRLSKTNDPWEASRFAALLASHSVTRRGLASVPTQQEIAAAAVEIISKT